jgi:hypothetical protein
VRKGARWTDIYQGGVSLNPEIGVAVVAVTAATANPLRLEASYPARVLNRYGSSIDVEWTIRNVGDTDLIGEVRVEHEPGFAWCQQPYIGMLMPGDSATCRTHYFITTADMGRGYVHFNAMPLVTDWLWTTIYGQTVSFDVQLVENKVFLPLYW